MIGGGLIRQHPAGPPATRPARCVARPGFEKLLPPGAKLKRMKYPDWVQQFPAAVTICDRDGVILYMNDGAVQLFRKSGGSQLIGTNVLDCHPKPARARLSHMLATRETDVFHVEENGTTRIVYDAPWYVDGEYCGFVELSFEVPRDIRTFVR